MSDTAKPALSDMEKFEIAAEIEAEKAKLIDLVRTYAPGKELLLFRFFAANMRTQREAAPGEFDYDSSVHLDALESLVCDLER